MARNIILTRDEAEILTDLLMLTDEIKAFDLSSDIREMFGMVSQECELLSRGVTLSDIRKEWAERIINMNKLK
jgi:hypothetical protein